MKNVQVWKHTCTIFVKRINKNQNRKEVKTMTREFFKKVLATGGRAYTTKRYKYRVYRHNGLTKIARFDKDGNFKAIVAVF